MSKRSASDAGLESGPSKPIAADAIECANWVDRRRLLDIIDFWEEQSTHSESSDALERSKHMFIMLRSELTDPITTQSHMFRYSNEDVELLQKAMTTKMSRNWNEGTHLRIAKITNSIASKKDRAIHKRLKQQAEEETKERARKWPEDCRGCGCGSKKCSSCYEGLEDYYDEDSEDSEDLENLEDSETSKDRWAEDCRGCGCGSKRCSSCYEGLEDFDDSEESKKLEESENSEDSEEPENSKNPKDPEDPEE